MIIESALIKMQRADFLVAIIDGDRIVGSPADKLTNGRCAFIHQNKQ